MTLYITLRFSTVFAFGTTVTARFHIVASNFVGFSIVYVAIAKFSRLNNSLSFDLFLSINKQRPKYMQALHTFVHSRR